jgi:methyl-accepting chemotaxis protein
MIKHFFSKIGNKIVFFTGAILLFMAVTITFTFTYISYQTSKEQIKEIEAKLMASFDQMLMSEVETVMTMLQGFEDKIQASELTELQGKKLAADILRDIKYSEGGYFWADTKDGLNIVLPGKPEVEGTNRMNLLDAKGNKLVQNIIAAGISGGGFTEYWFPKLGQTEPLPKRGYSKLFKPFNWVVGTGLYYDDIDVIIGALKEKQQKEFINTIATVIAISLVILVIGILIAFYGSKRISKPIVELSEKTSLVSAGDLTVVMSTNLSDEVGILSNSISEMVHKLREIVSEISDGASNVVTASQQMSGASQVIADGAAEQAASTEEISTSMEEMVSSILQNTENANRTDNIATESSKRIVDLKEAFRETLNAMEQITAKSIIIKDISFQTNILALNAAVEAARAGDAGRGFSVVAGEVRKLSESTQKAALEIDELTKGSLEVANHSWELLAKLVPEFEETTNLVKEISASGLEQKVGADMINNAVQTLVYVTNQNSASSEELASSSEELAAQAETLKDVVGFFKVK